MGSFYFSYVTPLIILFAKFIEINSTKETIKTPVSLKDVERPIET